MFIDHTEASDVTKTEASLLARSVRGYLLSREANLLKQELRDIILIACVMPLRQQSRVTVVLCAEEARIQLEAPTRQGACEVCATPRLIKPSHGPVIWAALLYVR